MVLGQWRTLVGKISDRCGAPLNKTLWEVMKSWKKMGPVDPWVSVDYLQRRNLTQKKLNTVGIWNPTPWNTETFEIRAFWRSDFKWSSFQMVQLWLWYGPNHLKSGHLCKGYALAISVKSLISVRCFCYFVWYFMLFVAVS